MRNELEIQIAHLYRRAGFGLSPEQLKGATQKGLFVFEKDSLRICFGQEGKRPKELTAKAGSGQAMYVLKREKS